MAGEASTLDEVLGISERLSWVDQLRLISLLSERLRNEIGKEQEPVDMLSLAGLGAELWRKIDVDDYVEQERTSWDG